MGIFAYSHTEQTRPIMLKLEIFIGEFGSAVDGTTSRAITVDEVTTLDHEIFNLEMRHKRRMVSLSTNHI